MGRGSGAGFDRTPPLPWDGRGIGAERNIIDNVKEPWAKRDSPSPRYGTGN
jgi:hypothetical protein